MMHRELYEHKNILGHSYQIYSYKKQQKQREV